MVKRFYNNDDDENFFHEEDIDDDEMEEMEATAFVDQDGLIEVMHMDLAQSELNQALLEKAISLAEKSFFWRFRRTSTKMKEIEDIYKKLLAMTEQQQGQKDKHDGPQ